MLGAGWCIVDVFRMLLPGNLANAQSYSFQCMYHIPLLKFSYAWGPRFPWNNKQAPKHTGNFNFLTRTPPARGGGACQTLEARNFKLALVGTLPLIVTWECFFGIFDGSVGKIQEIEMNRGVERRVRMNLKPLMKAINQMPERSSVSELRLRVDQGDEEFADGAGKLADAGIPKLGKS